MDKTPLENSIREESRKTINSIREQEAAQMKELDAACASEIAAFKEENETQTHSRIQQEIFKLKNRSVLERKKHKLLVVEEFITRIVDETIKGIRNDVRYRNFLVGAIRDALGKMKDLAEVGLTGKDLAFRDEIMNVLKNAGTKPDIVITGDDTIGWGGCVVHDITGGRIFNSTIERIYFRKHSAIRREVVRILREKGSAL